MSTLIIILIVLWLLGLVTANTMGGLIHVLLVIAIVVVLVRVIQGRNSFGRQAGALAGLEPVDWLPSVSWSGVVRARLKTD